MSIIVVSNRLADTVRIVNGKIKYIPSSGGLATSLSAVFPSKSKDGEDRQYCWIGWPGSDIPENKKELVSKKLLISNCIPVFLPEDLIRGFYDGMCNRILWPLFHYFPEKCVFDVSFWEDYRKANELYAKTISKIATKDDFILVQDFHLLLLPGMLRKLNPSLSIGFFLHIPFPAFEIFRLLPRLWRSQILEGMLGADVVGFHTYDYGRFFSHSIMRVLGLEQKLDNILYNDRLISIKTLPLGIDVDKFARTAGSKKLDKLALDLKKDVSGRKIILSVDRLDYTKGIDNRLLGFELFLNKYPKFREKVSFIMLTVPSRTDVNEYKDMKKKIDGLVGRINGAYGTVHWNPLIYMYRALSFEELVALYRESNIALITPLRDGMNLVAKEYVASHRNMGGVLILSEMAGSAQELVESLLINPYSKEEIADGIYSALLINPEEQKKRMGNMFDRLEKNTVSNWLDDFLKAINEIKTANFELLTNSLTGSGQITIINQFRQSDKRLILLDFDGTLVPYKNDPELVVPSASLLKLLSRFTSDYKNHVSILSGRTREYLEKWFGKMRIVLVAEQGAWMKEEGARWKMTRPFSNFWKAKILPVMQKYTDLLPGSFIENKELSTTWHYRKTDPLLSTDVVYGLLEELTHLASNQEIIVLSQHKSIEVVSAGANKGNLALFLSKRQLFDFIIAIGNDTTDESMFSVINDKGYTVKVGKGRSYAKYFLDNDRKVISFLEELSIRRNTRVGLVPKSKLIQSSANSIAAV